MTTFRATVEATGRSPLQWSLGLARQLGMKTVAEGVEDRAGWDFFTQHRLCDLAQGYFIAKPMPTADIAGWITGWEANAENLINNIF